MTSGMLGVSCVARALARAWKSATDVISSRGDRQQVGRDVMEEE